MLYFISSMLFPAALGAWFLMRQPRRFSLAVMLGFGACAVLNLLSAVFSRGTIEVGLSRSFGILITLDDFGRVMYALIGVLIFLAALFALDYTSGDANRSRLFGFFALTLGALNGVAASGNLFTLYLYFEFVSLLSYPLVLQEGTERARHAALVYLGFSIAGAALALAGLMLAGEAALLPFSDGGINLLFDEKNVLACLFVAVGFGCKAGIYPLSAWLPTAHPEAPAPASAILSGVITKAGMIGIVRSLYYVFGPELIRGSYAQYTLIGLALVTIFIGSMLAYKEPILKKRLAYSSVSQLSYAVLGFALLNEAGFCGAMLQVVFHMIAKTGLFLCAGSIIHATGQTRVRELVGVGRDMPLTLAGFTLLSLSLIGIPPLGGFIAKWRLCEGALAFGGALGTTCVIVLLLSALLTAGYLLPITALGYFPGKEYVRTDRETGWRMLLPLALLAAAAVALGAFPNGMDHFFTSIFEALNGGWVA